MIRASKITLVSALAAALAGGMGTSPEASANAALNGGAVVANVGTTSGIASIPGGWLNDNQLGQVLLFPYYTVLDDANGRPFVTSFVITNTDRNNVVVLKFRLRDHVNSQDVLDFMLILSPGDEAVAFLSRNPNGQPQVNFPAEEASCRVPWLNGAQSFLAPGGTVQAADATTGHLEVIPVAALPATGTLAQTAVHASATHNCNVLSQLFLSGTGGAAGSITAALNSLANTTVAIPGIGNVAITAPSTAAPVGNMLRGAYRITNPGGGYSAGGSALAVANWMVAPLVFAQNNLTVTPTQLNGKDTHEFDHPHLGDSINTVDIDQSSIAAASVINNWSVNPASGVGIDWVVTYYTKYLWRDINGFYGSSSVATNTGGGTYSWPATGSNTGVGLVYKLSNGIGACDIATPGSCTSPWSETANGAAASNTAPLNGGTCVHIGLASTDLTQVLDREEDVSGVTGGISPGPPGTASDICNEANVISFSQGVTRKPVLLGNGALVIDTSALNLPFGWTDLQVNSTAALGALPTVKVAVAGFAFTLRDLGDPTTAFGSISDHDLKLIMPAAGNPLAPTQF